jgi:BirA family biotin operon repressor/biotin-[acetyl-CoA-carboxylase] ligase
MMQNVPAAAEVLNYLHQVIRPASGLPEAEAEMVARYGAFVGSTIESHRELDRAMNRARDIITIAAKQGRSTPSGLVILAEALVRSKGRFSRHWHAPPGGIWGCMVHANTLLPQSRRFIPLATGVACCQALQSLGAAEVRLRWVNDVLWRGLKLAGFLVESYTEPESGEEFTLVGFGINVNNREFPQELGETACALCDVLGASLPLAVVAGRFLAYLAWNFGILYREEERALREEGFSGADGGHLLLQQWRALSDSIGKTVIFGFDVMTSPQYRAEVLAVDADGGLVLRLPDNRIITEYSGEIRYL